MVYNLISDDMKKIKNIIYCLILIILIILFIFSLKNIITWFQDNNNTKKIVKEIKDNTDIKEIKTDDNNEEVLIDVDLNSLKKINEDTVGYIKVKGTNIDYPIVQTNDNEFYLTHSFDKSYNKAGWVFLDYRNHLNVFDDNTIIYAHGRLDNTMFGSLRNVVKESWYTNSDNYYIQYSNEYYSSKWQVFSSYKIKETTDYLNINYNNLNEKQNFINLLLNRSIYDYKTSVTASDKIITLSSCYDDYYRVVLHAKLIKYVKK